MISASSARRTATGVGSDGDLDQRTVAQCEQPSHRVGRLARRLIERQVSNLIDFVKRG